MGIFSDILSSLPQAQLDLPSNEIFFLVRSTKTAVNDPKHGPTKMAYNKSL